METLTVVSGSDLAKKKQKFVAGRFNEFESFGRSDIEPWLEGQRTARVPDMGDNVHHCLRNHSWSYKGWDFFMWKMFYSNACCKLFPNHTPLEVLRKHGATVVANSEKHAKNYPHIWREKDLLLFLTKYAQNKSYCAGNRLLFDLGEPMGTLSLCFEVELDRVRYSRSIDPCEVAHSLRLNWKYNGSDATGCGARDFLCDCLQREINLERGKIEADFDTAVGVTEDGTKIVSADKVVLFRINGGYPRTDMRIYPRKDFKETKLLKGKDVPRTKFHLQSSDIPNIEKKITEAVFGISELVTASPNRQVFAEFSGDEESFTVFILQIAGAFPEGGVMAVP